MLNSKFSLINKCSRNYNNYLSVTVKPTFRSVTSIRDEQTSTLLTIFCRITISTNAGRIKGIAKSTIIWYHIWQDCGNFLPLLRVSWNFFARDYCSTPRQYWFHCKCVIFFYAFEMASFVPVNLHNFQISSILLAKNLHANDLYFMRIHLFRK